MPLCRHGQTIGQMLPSYHPQVHSKALRICKEAREGKDLHRTQR